MEITQRTRITNAICLTEGHVTDKPSDIDIEGSLTEIGENEMVQRVLLSGKRHDVKTIDPLAVIDAFQRYGGPLHFGGRFVMDDNGLVYACDRVETPRPTVLQMLMDYLEEIFPEESTSG